MNRVPPLPAVLLTDGACIGRPPEWWTDYSSNHRATRTAKQVCQQCPVIAECLQWARSANPRGVWAGRWRAGRTGP